MTTLTGGRSNGPDTERVVCPSLLSNRNIQKSGTIAVQRYERTEIERFEQFKKTKKRAEQQIEIVAGPTKKKRKIKSCKVSNEYRKKKQKKNVYSLFAAAINSQPIMNHRIHKQHLFRPKQFRKIRTFERRKTKISTKNEYAWHFG